MTAPARFHALRSGAFVLFLCICLEPLRAADTTDAPAAAGRPPIPHFIELIWTGAAYVGLDRTAIHTSSDGITRKQVHTSEKTMTCIAAFTGDEQYQAQ